jgi:hypothetical protein
MKVDVTDENRSKCLCPQCPTHDIACMEGQTLYCGAGETDCDPKAHGCLCGQCPITSIYDLVSTYFCMEGAAE